MSFNCVLDVERSGFGSEVITLTEVKSHINVTFSDYDTYLTDLIKQVRQWAESYTGLAIVSQTVQAAINNSLGGQYLPYGPVTAISAIVDSEGATIPDPEYRGIKFKQLHYPCYDYILLTYTAGYGANVPADIKKAMLDEIAYQWNHRGDEMTSQGLSAEAIAKLKPHRRVGWLL